MAPVARRSSPRARTPRWLGLTEASRFLGVSPATLRRWSDAGRVKTFTTPGGHRRYARAALESLLPSQREHRPSVRVMGVTPERVARAYRRNATRATSPLPWLVALDDAQRDDFRRRGREVAVHLLAFLDAETPESRDHRIREAAASSAGYGRLAADLGLSLSQTVEGFLRFRAPFIGELMTVARRRGLDTTEVTELLETTEGAMDRLLVATMTGHSVVTVGRGREVQP